MKIVVWNGCQVIAEHTYRGDGPDIDLDPDNLPEKIVVRRLVDGREISQVVDLSEVAR